MKYIDAGRLKAEINKRKKSLRAGICGEAFTRKQKNEMLVASEELDRFNRIIDSLQQEQPDFPTTDEEIEIFLATHPKVEVPDKYKTPDWLWKKLEQPEVDLKKEIKEWADLMVGASFPEQDGDFISEEDYRDVIRQTARHFYELGLNARKEESR